MTFDFNARPDIAPNSDFTLEWAVPVQKLKANIETGLVSEAPLAVGEVAIPLDMSRLGSVVGFQQKDGRMALASWLGESLCIWARMAKPGELPHLIYMRNQIVEAYNADGPRPPGTIRMVCLRRTL